MAANRTSQDLTERMVDGFLQYDYSETWQVDATGIAAALLDPSLPQIGQPYLITGVSTPVYCFSRTPRRRSDSQAKNLFDVVCAFTNAVTRYERTVDGLPADQPESIVPRVDVAFEEYSEQTGTAKNGFIGIFDLSVSPSLFDPALSYQPPPKLNPPQFGVSRPIINSAGDPFENVTVRKHTKRITYWSWHRDWDANWDNWLDVVNSTQTTITQSDKDGQRLRYTFDPYTLLINDIIKEDHWRDGSLYFRRGIVISHNPSTWFSVFVDRGFNELLFEGQNKPGGGTVTSSEMDDLFGTSHGEYESLAITTPVPVFGTGDLVASETRVAPAEPQLLNGYGRLVGTSTPADVGFPKQMVYLAYESGDYSTIGIS